MCFRPPASASSSITAVNDDADNAAHNHVCISTSDGGDANVCEYRLGQILWAGGWHQKREKINFSFCIFIHDDDGPWFRRLRQRCGPTLPAFKWNRRPFFLLFFMHWLPSATIAGFRITISLLSLHIHHLLSHASSRQGHTWNICTALLDTDFQSANTERIIFSFHKLSALCTRQKKRAPPLTFRITKNIVGKFIFKSIFFFCYCCRCLLYCWIISTRLHFLRLLTCCFLQIPCLWGIARTHFLI